MNSLYLKYFVTGLLFLTSSCQVKSLRTSNDESQVQSQTLVDPKYSLSKDRSEFDKIREAVPAEIKKSNDEKALMAEWFGDVKLAPEIIREKHDTLVRKKRDLFNKDISKSREEFNKIEHKKKDEFLKKLEESRKDFLSQKSDREKRADFFNEQDEQRRTYFSEQKDKREDFESDVREKRKNYEDYIKEKNDEFNAELKIYKIKWAEKNKS